jgi:glutathionyl-hydroquinone reductase
MRDIWQLSIADRPMQVPDTIDIDAAARSYYGSLFPVNPSGIVPSGPRAADLGLEKPAGRGSPLLADACFLKAGAPVS